MTSLRAYQCSPRDIGRLGGSAAERLGPRPPPRSSPFRPHIVGGDASAMRLERL